MAKIDDFFRNVQFKRVYMEAIHQEYNEALRIDYEDYSFSSYGSRFSDISVSSSKKINDLKTLSQYVEEKEREYNIARRDFENEKKVCMLTINKLYNKTYQLIIKYAYIDEYSNKEIISNLEKYHRSYFSEAYFRRIKKNAVKKFEELI